MIALSLLLTLMSIIFFIIIKIAVKYVRVEDISGDLQDLVGSPIIIISREDSNKEFKKQLEIDKYKYDDYYTWTFYNFVTNKGYVNIRWLGESNGYYSVSVSFYKIILPENVEFVPTVCYYSPQWGQLEFNWKK